MRILHINASYKPAYIYGGPTMSVSKLCEELVKAGQTPEVLTTTANGASELAIEAGLRKIVHGVPVIYFRRLTKGNSHLSPALVLSLWKSLKTENYLGYPTAQFSNRPVIVHIHAWWNMVSVLSCFVALILSRQVLLSPRGTLSKYSFGNRKGVVKKIFHIVIGRVLLKRCHFHVSTEKEKQDILSIIHPQTITIIPNFVNLATDYDPTLLVDPLDKPRFDSKQSNEKSKSFKILFLSRVEEKKGLNVLFKALQTIEIDYELTIAGTGDENYILSLKSLASQLNIADKVTWIGQQSNKDKFKILSTHDLMVLPSYDESFGNVVIESLSVGTPVLISSKVGLADYVLANNLGWVYTDNETQLASSIIEAITNKPLRIAIRQKAPAQIQKDYDNRRLVKSYIEMYKNICSTYNPLNI